MQLFVKAAPGKAAFFFFWSQIIKLYENLVLQFYNALLIL